MTDWATNALFLSPVDAEARLGELDTIIKDIPADTPYEHEAVARLAARLEAAHLCYGLYEITGATRWLYRSQQLLKGNDLGNLRRLHAEAFSAAANAPTEVQS